MSKPKDLKEYFAMRDDLFRNPTLEKAQAWWISMNYPEPAKFDVPLAAVHKGRLQWLDATDAMLVESIRWLVDNGYKAEHFDAPPLTPQQRDNDRRLLGKKPLGEE
jgi:hypothetical protein